jgi:RNA polymerase sigma-70 factor (ECF subfamily)
VGGLFLKERNEREITKFIIFVLAPRLNKMGKKAIDFDQVSFIQLKNGDKQAFNHLFNLYSQKIFYFAKGYLKSEKEAEEIVQETFFKIWERRNHLDPELSINAYLFKIAYNFIQKQFIKNIKEQEFKHDFADELIHFDEQTSNTLNYHFLLDHLSRLIDELPPRQKEIVILRKLDNYSIKEISEQLSISIKTIEAHLTAALKFLKERLKSEKFEDLLLFALIFRKK